MVVRGFSDPKLVANLAAEISAIGQMDVQLMEVCGTHTVSFAMHGIRSLLPKGVRITSGPGCPVCVTSDSDLSLALQAAGMKGVTLATFGDMMRVPVDGMSLLDLKARGADIKTLYSPLDALSMAEERQVVFFGVGFETTSPGVAALLREAERKGVRNLSVISCFKLIPPAMRALLQEGGARIDGLILPGHVSTIIGSQPYRFLVDELRVPCVIAGFEPVDLMMAILVLLRMLSKGKVELVNAYPRSVRHEGNSQALSLLREYFEPADTEWRGLGRIPDSGLAVRAEHSDMDARLRFDLKPSQVQKPSGCRCADVLRGLIAPSDCPLFSVRCTPESPMGPCMVSSEGACVAWYNYG